MSIGNRGGASAPKLAQQQDSASQGQAGQQTAADNQPNTGSDEAQIALVPDVPAIVSSTTETQTERDQQRADADLQAQQDMAFYALLMVIATVATVLITSLGVWFVKRTLDATLRAVEDTSEATEAMQEANKIASDTAKRQLRAYAGCIETVIDFGTEMSPRKATIHFRIRNAGQTPANEVRCISAVHIIEGNANSYKFRFRDNEDRGNPASGIVQPNNYTSQSVSRDLEGCFRALLSREKTLVFAAIISYRDVFGVRRLHTTKVFFNPEGFKGGLHPMALCERGNKAN